MSISVGGLVSGLDTNSIISQLMELQQQPIATLQTKQSNYEVKLTTYGSLQSLLSQLKTEMEGLDSAEDLTSFSVSSGNSNLFTATVDSDATAGAYDITVQQLAQAHKLTSTAFSDEELVGEGTLHLKVGTGDAIDIEVSTTDTLADVADAINDAEAGVHASVINDGTNSFLTLTADDTGEENVINLTVTDTGDANNTDTNGLSRLVYDAGVTTNLSNTRDSADAIITVDGVTNIHRTTNVMDDVIEGVTLNLNSAPDTDNEASLTITQNTSTLVSKINSFVSLYNQVLTFFEAAQGYNSETEVAGVMMGDPTTNSIRNSLKRLITNKVSGIDSYDQLADLGVSLNAEGRLEVDASTLNDAINDHFDDVDKFFTQTTVGSEGFAVRMGTALEAMIGTDGTLASRTEGLQSSIDGIDDQVERMEMQNLAFETRIRSQFNSLELLLSEYQSTGDFLSQQITGLQNLNNAISNR
ncbi:MAG: flagellar filament capping protein FliD [Pseudomonadota bacterium]